MAQVEFRPVAPAEDRIVVEIVVERGQRYSDRARTRTVRAGCNERLRSDTYNAEWRSSGGTIPSRIVEVPAARAATKTKKDLQEMQAFDYSWTQRGMIPRPSDYESAALTD